MVKAGAKPQEFRTSKSTTSTHPMESSNIPLENQETVETEEPVNVDVQLLDHLCSFLMKVLVKILVKMLAF